MTERRCQTKLSVAARIFNCLVADMDRVTDDRMFRSRLPAPPTAHAKIGYSLAILAKKGVGALATALFRLPLCGNQLEDQYTRRTLWQLALLEAACSIPGHVEGLVILLKQLVFAQPAPDRLKSCLEDASDSYTRLTTWIELLQPRLIGRLLLLVMQAAVFVAYLLGFLIAPEASLSCAAYLESVSSQAYELTCIETQADTGLLHHFGDQVLPWNQMTIGSTVRDALPKFCIQAEERSATLLSAAHSEESIWSLCLQTLSSSRSKASQAPLQQTAPEDAKPKEIAVPQMEPSGTLSPIPADRANSPADRNPRWRPSSNSSLNKVSQLFESKWATPRDHAADVDDIKQRDRISEDSSAGLPPPTEVAGNYKAGASAVDSNGDVAPSAEGWLVFPQPVKDATSRDASPVEEEREASSPGPAQEGTGVELPKLASQQEEFMDAQESCGSAVPSSVLTNHDLEKLVETNDAWITTRTGIRERRILAEGETLSHLAVTSSLRALEMAGIEAQDLDLVLLATSSPDDAFGSACQVQAEIGAKRSLAFDLTAACSGFVIGLVTATQFIRTGTYRNVLVIGADALSRYIDWRDRATCILFGDGCGAVVLTAQEGQCSLLSSSMFSDGLGHKHLRADFTGGGNKAFSSAGCASGRAAYNNIVMNGSEVFRFAVRAVPKVVQQSLDAADLQVQDLDWLVLHQANQRILDSAAERLGFPAERVVSNLAKYGNTSAASIPLVLDEAVRGGKIQPGHTLAMAGFGAGLTWASAIVRWQ
ncbi:hypothetical protein WJX73_005537 [Symbiochloris irregularis]|uniref:Ubiquinol oxidase n=1 Tax=Symbiochloris irregularis TaxID=706552 RepID=A0AAW1NXT6_9CHLO